MAPSVFECEFSHANGNAMGHLKEYVEVFRTQARAMGGCIWDYVDQAIWTKLGSYGVYQEGGPYALEGSASATTEQALFTQQLIALGARTVIFSGIAGSLNPALHIEDVVIGQTLRYVDTDTALIAESAPGLEEFHSTDWLVDLAAQALLARGYTELPAEKSNNCADGDAPSSPAVTSAQGEQQFLVGTISTGNRFVTGPLKAQVLEATHADCAEMEGAAVAHVCAKNGVDCLVLRAISDNCDEAYDAFSSRVFDIEEYARSASALVLDILGSIDAHAKN